jgi:hypothetical protein
VSATISGVFNLVMLLFLSSVCQRSLDNFLFDTNVHSEFVTNWEAYFFQRQMFMRNFNLQPFAGAGDVKADRFLYIGKCSPLRQELGVVPKRMV